MALQLPIRTRGGSFADLDEVCADIVDALKEKNWSVPGIKITFKQAGSGDTKYYYVQKIAGENFLLQFGRRIDINSQTRLRTQIEDLCLEKTHRHLATILFDKVVHTTYIGTDWKHDQKTFQKLALDYLAVPSLEKKCWSSPTYERCSASEFKLDVAWLRCNVLAYIQAQSSQSPVPLPFIKPAIPFPSQHLPLYVRVTAKELKRIQKGKENPKQLPPHKRFGLSTHGLSLATIYDCGRSGLPKLACRSCRHCHLKEPTHLLNERGYRVVKLFPKDARYIYVYDEQPAIAHKTKCLATVDRLTDEHLRMAIRMAMKTCVSITDYKGDYIVPVVILSANVGQLSLDEVELY